MSTKKPLCNELELSINAKHLSKVASLWDLHMVCRLKVRQL